VSGNLRALLVEEMFLSDIPETVAEEKKTGKAIKRVRRLLLGLEQGSGNFMEKRNLSDMRDPTPAEKAHRIELQCNYSNCFFWCIRIKRVWS
jgi:hypothetical protein